MKHFSSSRLSTSRQQRFRGNPPYRFVFFLNCALYYANGARDSLSFKAFLLRNDLALKGNFSKMITTRLNKNEREKYSRNYLYNYQTLGFAKKWREFQLIKEYHCIRIRVTRRETRPSENTICSCFLSNFKALQDKQDSYLFPLSSTFM